MGNYFLILRYVLSHIPRISNTDIQGWFSSSRMLSRTFHLSALPFSEFYSNSLFTPKMTMLPSSIISSYYNVRAQEGTNLHLVCVDDILYVCSWFIFVLYIQIFSINIRSKLTIFSHVKYLESFKNLYTLNIVKTCKVLHYVNLPCTIIFLISFQL